MQSGRVYIGRLPNHNGPVFVRKRRKSFANPFGIPSITSIHAAQRYVPDYHCTTTAMYQPPPPTYVMPAPSTQVVQVSQPVEASTTTVTTTIEPQAPSKYSCASCGKFRSARYHYRHPLASGETPRPTLCRKCVNQHTSSEDFEDMERARWKRRHRESCRPKHRSYSSEEWSNSSSHEERRRHHRYRSSDESRRHARSDQSSSGRSTKIYIIRAEARREQPSSSSEHVRITRRARTDADRPRPILRTRHRYGPYDGHYSHEEYREDVEVDEDDDDYFQPRGRSRSRIFGRQSHEGSYEDEYVRVSTSKRSRPLSLFDRLTGSRSRSRQSSSYDEERVRISIRSREPSPLHFERHFEEHEERLEELHRSPWRRGSDSVLVHHDSKIQTRGGNFLGRPHSSSSQHVHVEERSSGHRSPRRLRRSLRGHSPESILRRRGSIDHGSSHRPRVRFARSTSSHREDHQDSYSNHHRRRHYRPGSDLSFSDEDFPSAGSGHCACTSSLS